MSLLENFKAFNFNEGVPYVSVTSNGMTFNKSVIMKLGCLLYTSQRIQSRMFMMYGVNDTNRLHFATAAGKIGNGLDEQLENRCV